MKNRFSRYHFLSRSALAGLALPFGASSALAAAFTWDGGAADGGRWGNAINWTADSGVPNAIGDTATGISGTLVLADASGADASFILSSFSKSAGSSTVTINNVASGTGKLIFDVASGQATITSSLNAGKLMDFRVGIVLNDTLAVTSFSGANALRFFNPITSGAGLTTGLTITGTTTGSSQPVGYVQILAAATYTGTTTVQGTISTSQTSGVGGGKLLIGGNDFLPTTTVLTVDASSAGGTSVPQGGRFDLGGFNQTVAGLAGSAGTARGTVTNDVAAATTGMLTINNTGSHVYNGVIADAVTGGNLGKTALTKTGAGTQTLAGTNTHTGATSVTAGTLVVSGSIASSATTVGSGATLALSGSGAAGAVTVNSGTFQLGTAGIAGAVAINGGTFGGSGTVNSLVFTGAGNFGPGNSPGTVTIANGGTFTLGADTTSTFQFTDSGFGIGTFDLVTTPGTGTGTIAGILNLDFTGSGYTAGTSVTFINLASITGTFSSVNVTGLTDLTATLNYDNALGDVSLTLASAIPEPSSYAALFGVTGLGVALLRRRRN